MMDLPHIGLISSLLVSLLFGVALVVVLVIENRALKAEIDRQQRRLDELWSKIEKSKSFYMRA